MSSYDQAYHPPNCNCDLPPGPISVQEFLRSCFYPRLLANTENRVELTIGGIRSEVSQPLRRDFLGREYKDTDIWDASPRHPLLCLDGHYTWGPEDDKTPSSFTVNTGGITLSTLKNLIQRGDYIAGAHFKHHHGEKDDCHCGRGRDAEGILLAEQRKAALLGRTNGTPVLQDYGGVYELRFHVQSGSEGLPVGVQRVEGIQNPAALHPSDLEDDTSVWLQSRDAGALPGNCAGFLCFENSPNKTNLFIPDVGKIVLIIPEARCEAYFAHLSALKKKIPDGVKMAPGRAKDLQQLTGYRQGIIEWNDSESQDEVKQFLQKITGLESHVLRSTRPLMMEVHDKAYQPVTPVSQYRLSEFAFDAGDEFYVKIRRMRNAPLDGFRLLLGPGIDSSALVLRGLEASNLGADDASGGTLWKIFVRGGDLQNGLWAALQVHSHHEGAWVEVFDHGSTVEQSGTRLQIVTKESI
jgi:hypothetical protein